MSLLTSAFFALSSQNGNFETMTNQAKASTLFIISLWILCLGSYAHAGSEGHSSEHDILDFDFMLEHFRPTRKGDIEIAMFKKIQFEAEISDLPTQRKSTYLQKLLADFTADNPPSISMGMMAKSKKGKTWNLYILDELVPQANDLLRPGDKVTLYAYHAYTSDYGPGVVVHAFDRHARPTLWQKTKAWFTEITHENK